MVSEESAIRRAAAADQFDLHEQREDGVQVSSSLAGGLTILRDSLFARVHDEVRRRVGMDSMLLPVSPVSEEKTERMTKLEIELYQIASSATTAAARGYVTTKDDWFVNWLCRLRMGPLNGEGKVSKRLAYYLSKTPDERRLAFTNVLVSALPESRGAPLVVFRLMPLAVEIVTALAFGDQDSAQHARRQQTDILSAIRDCRECHGKLLDNGEQCRACGNPMWKYEWLTAAD